MTVQILVAERENGDETSLISLLLLLLLPHSHTSVSSIYIDIQGFHEKSSRGRNQDALLAACLYIACLQEDKPRTVKNIHHSLLQWHRASNTLDLSKQLGLETGQSVEMGTIHAGDLMRRFCSNLAMSNQTVKAAQESVQKSEDFDIRRSPISITAGLSDDKKPLRDISVATGVAQGTIRNSYKDLYP
ncbi:hypothetical protein EUTSA_v10015304mg [Eutrema salsugineum]|uniref:Transcription factor TFIIB cyclin-like domain-containing protein n=1 Tax=Eutrema salsugineum TaxID=72664 RepID=V4KQX4_EUTSA|nr:hypothetical protein EUTSA_v10015304mg [Eutrema salsugineum]